MYCKILSFLIFSHLLLNSALSWAQGSEVQWSELRFSNNREINQHHFLYQLATDKYYQKQVLSKSGLASEQLLILTDAIVQYKNKATKQPLFHGNKAIATLTRQLINKEKIEPNNQVNRAFLSISSIYQTLYWPTHQTENQKWLDKLLNKLNKHGVKLSDKLSTLLITSEIIEAPHRFHIVYNPGVSRLGDVTFNDHDSLIMSDNYKYRGWAAVETIFSQVAYKLVKPSASAFRRFWGSHSELNIASLPSWQTLYRYSVGKVIEQQVPAYLSNADRKMIGNERLNEILTHFWEPYLRQEVSIKQAINNIQQATQKERSNGWIFYN